jgi:hypothetical protein
MRTKIVYNWEKHDPSVTFVDKAINRLISFQNEVGDELAIKSLNKITNNCDFNDLDIRLAPAHLRELAKRARAKWDPNMALARKMPQMAAAIYQAADNAIDASDRLVNLFMEAAYGFQTFKLGRRVELLAEKDGYEES